MYLHLLSSHPCHTQVRYVCITRPTRMKFPQISHYCNCFRHAWYVDVPTVATYCWSQPKNKHSSGTSTCFTLIGFSFSRTFFTRDSFLVYNTLVMQNLSMYSHTCIYLHQTLCKKTRQSPRTGLTGCGTSSEQTAEMRGENWTASVQWKHNKTL